MIVLDSEIKFSRWEDVTCISKDTIPLQSSDGKQALNCLLLGKLHLYCFVKWNTGTESWVSKRAGIVVSLISHLIYIFCFVLFWLQGSSLGFILCPANTISKYQYLTGCIMVSPFHLGVILDKYFCVAWNSDMGF